MTHITLPKSATPQLQRQIVFPAAFIIVALSSAALLPLSLSKLVSIGLLGVGILVALWRPFSSLLLLIASIPIISLYKRLQYMHSGSLQEFNNPISLLPQAIIIVLLFHVIIGTISTMRMRRPSPITLAIMAMLAIYAIGILYTPSLIAGIFGLRAIGIAMLAYFIGWRFINTEQRLKLIIIFMTLAGIALSLYGVKQWLLGLFPFEYSWAVSYVGTSDVGWFLVWYGMLYLRVFGSLATPFEFAASMMVVPLFLYIAFLEVRLWWVRHIIICCGGAALGALYATGVRGAWFGFFAAALLMLLLNHTRNPAGLLVRILTRGLPIILALILGFLLLLPILEQSGSPIIRRVITLANPLQVGEMQMRYQRWSEALDLVAEHPFGTGTGSTGFSAQRFGDQDAIIPDSMYIQTLAEVGIPGLLIIFLLFALTGGVYFYRFYSLQVPLLRRVALLILCMAAGIAVHGFTTPLQESQMMIVWFWLLLGAGENLQWLHITEHRPVAATSRFVHPHQLHAGPSLDT